ncbi:zinc finger, CCHC-type containing protein [Tanacetum coccineum]
MTDSRLVMEQYNELLGILGRFTQHKMNMDEAIQVSYIIEKLPPSWNDFKHTLKYLKEKLTLVELGSHLRIEESLRMQDSDKQKRNHVVGPSVVNMVEHNNSSRHLKKDCKGEKVGNKANGSGTDGSVDGSTNSLKAFMSTSKLNYSILWHARPGHVHFKRMQDMSKDGLIPAFDMDTEKCKTCMLNKITKKPFQNVKHETEVLELIHSDLCDLHATPSLGNKKYFVTFIDDASRAVVRLLDPKLNNLGERGIECIFVGYAEHSKAFRFSSVPRPSLRITNGTEDIGGSVVLEDVTEEVDETIEKCQDKVDVKTAFLNGNLDEEAPKQWHQKFDEVVLSNGYLLNQADACVYSKFNETDKGVIICLYIDDMLIFGTDQVQVDLTKEFCHQVSTPMDTSEKLMPNNGQAVSQLEYSRVIGCLMYAMTCTRPDIAFVVGKLSRYTSNPGTQHWQAIQRVLKYLKKTMDYRLTYTGYPSVLEGYTDASWISNTKDNSSTSGWVFLLGGGAISWASKKQTYINGLTMESEFMALTAAGKEAEWLKNLLLEILLWSKLIAPIYIRCDSAATLAKAYSQMYNEKSRHLGVTHNMIHELITNGVISIEFVRSQQNVVDHLTKRLARDLVIKSAEGMGLKSN